MRLPFRSPLAIDDLLNLDIVQASHVRFS
jgi:hypothetical protein